MYNLRITGLTEQRDMPSLVKVLLKIPGLKPDDVSRGLKAPPFKVFSTEQEDYVEKLKTILEKFGARCAIENTKALRRERSDSEDESKRASIEEYLRNRRSHSRRFRRNFWLTMVSIIVVFTILSLLDFSGNKKTSPANQPKKQVSQTTRVVSDRPSNNTKNDEPKSNANEAKANAELKKEIQKNPYNADAWKNLAENLEKQGDEDAARQAKESYDRVVKTQMVLANLAKAFGNRVRVEIKENEVFYRTAYDFTDEQFYKEAGKLMNSMDEKFPGKDLIVENYTSDNRFQSIKLKSTIKAKFKDK